MSGELTISAGDASTVAVDELFVDAARLGAASTVIEGWIERAGVIRRGLALLPLPGNPGMWEPGSSTNALVHVDRELRSASELADSLRGRLNEAAERYGAAERFIDGLWSLGASLGAQWLGFATPALVGASVLAVGANAAGSRLWRDSGLGATPLERWLDEHRGLLSDPAFVRLVRVAADHADEFAVGAAHVPLPPALVAAIGSAIGGPENASVLLGLAGAAGAAGVAGSRVLVDGPVRVDRAASRSVDAPTGIGDLADRVPAGAPGDPQIRIERYGADDDPRWIVYIGGTVDPGVVAGDEPFDMTSNLHGVAAASPLDELRLAGADSGAGERAVREAMRAAGVAPGDPVLPVGYSGGGLIAANLAADAELNVVGAVNLGGPVASVSTDGVGLLSIEHAEDVVPATGGAGHPSPDRLTVSRSALDPEGRYGSLLPAHELARYRETAALVDGSEEARLVQFRTLVGDVTGGRAGTRSDWVATRDLSRETPDGR